MAIKIVTDSTCDLSPEVIDKYEIEIIPLSIHVEGKSYRDGVDLTKSEFLKILTTAKELPKSSQPSLGAFKETYERLAASEPNVQIISIHLANTLSGTFQTAQTAADMVDIDVTVVNSNFISHALGYQVLEAARLANQGQSVEEIIDRLQTIRAHTSLHLMVDTLEYLAKGGRIGKGKALLGSLLKIKPIASLANGVYTPIGKVRTYWQMIQMLTRKFEEETKGRGIRRISIAHIGADQLAQRLKESLQNASEITEIPIIVTSPIISAHTGPGAVALMYYTD